MLGYASAKAVVDLGRGGFFSPASADLPQNRSPELSLDDLIPQFGYVGRRYHETRILLVGINPGNGPSSSARTAGDAAMMPAAIEFARSPTPENFESASKAYMRQCVKWPVWKRHCSEVLGAGKLSFDEIAYTNCLPWRTESKSTFTDDVSRRAARFYFDPLIDELVPRIVIAMGKRAAEIVRMASSPVPQLITWNRSQAATSQVKQERAETARHILAAVEEFRKGASQ